MKVQDVMTSEVKTCRLEQSLAAAITSAVSSCNSHST